MKVMMVGVVWLTVLVTAIFVVRSRQEEMQAVRPRGGHPGNPGGASSGMDLLDLLDIPQDAVKGVWGFSGRSLIAPAGPYSRLQFPVIPPAEYDFLAEVTRVKGNDSLDIGLPLGGKQILLVIDGGECSGLEYIDKNPFNGNETSAKGRFLVGLQAHRIKCSVRKSGVQVSIDGKVVIDWSLEKQSFGIQENWNVFRKDVPFLGSWETSYSFDDVRLVPVGGEAKRLRSASPDGVR